MSQTITERLLRRVRIDETTGCWIWLGATGDGYGLIRVGGVLRNTHIVSYELFVGPVPTGLELHHGCENRPCCNPVHVGPVTRQRHLVELTPGCVAYVAARKTHCDHGHEFTPANTYLEHGRRQCRACGREKARRYREKRAAKAS